MNNSEVPALELNICIDSYQQLKLGIQKWQFVNQVLLQKGKSIPIAHINNARPGVKFNEKLKYYSIEYNCAGNPEERTDEECPFKLYVQASYNGNRLVISRLDDQFAHNHPFVEQEHIQAHHLYRNNANSAESEDENANSKRKWRIRNDTHSQLVKRMKQRESRRQFLEAHIDVQTPILDDVALENKVGASDKPAPTRRYTKLSDLKESNKTTENASKRKKRAIPQQQQQSKRRRQNVDRSNDDEEEDTWQVSLVEVPPKTATSHVATNVARNKQSKKTAVPKKRKPTQRKTRLPARLRQNVDKSNNDDEEEDTWQVSLVEVPPKTATSHVATNVARNKQSKKKAVPKKRNPPQRKPQLPARLLPMDLFPSDDTDDDEEFHGWDAAATALPAILPPRVSSNGSASSSEKLTLTIRNLPRRTRQPPKRVSSKDQAAADGGIWEVVDNSNSLETSDLNGSLESCASNSSAVKSPKLKRRTRQQPKRFRGYGDD